MWYERLNIKVYIDNSIEKREIINEDKKNSIILIRYAELDLLEEK